MNKKLIIVGAGETAQVAYEYFVADTNYKVECFAVSNVLTNKNEQYQGIKIISLENALENNLGDKADFFIAISYIGLNIVREQIFDQLKKIGVSFASYVSPKANISRTAEIGKNCFIQEFNNIQHKVKIEDNCILWAGNHIGHQSIIKKSNFLSSHICVAGYAAVGARSFMGINSSLGDYKTIADDNLIGIGACINFDTDMDSIYTGNPATKHLKISASNFLKRKKYVK